ncbi:hypothetical protein GM3709_3775 (plasmid) [Geminocystis sp. NIES-3709]|nr:hypothetical protein GM3709_3775 [Geminocystis sp. NIES-3709]
MVVKKDHAFFNSSALSFRNLVSSGVKWNPQPLIVYLVTAV